MTTGLQIVGEATGIVHVLRDFGRHRPVPIGFVARAIGRDSAEIRDSLSDLSDRQIISLDEARGSVTLIR